MKTFRKIQKIAIVVGMVYGLWLGSNVDATDADARSAFVIVVLTCVVAISMFTPDKKDTKAV